MSETQVRPRNPQRRRDPAVRHVEATRPGSLLNADPSYKYVGVSKLAPIGHDITAYEDMGYEVCFRGEGQARFKGTKERSDGSVEEFNGHVLMRVPIQRWHELQKTGPYGDSGQELADMLEGRIIDRDMATSQKDTLRGLGTRPEHLRLENTAPESDELRGIPKDRRPKDSDGGDPFGLKE